LRGEPVQLSSIACGLNEAIMSPWLSRISYTIEWRQEGYGVRAATHTGQPVVIGPFVTKGEAQAWIDASDEQNASEDSDGLLGWPEPFGRA
jgi:hypothetical protein